MEVDEESDHDEIFVHPDDPVPWFPEQQSPSSSSEKPLRLKRRKRCGECGPCQIKTNCGECPYCVRRSVLKQSCIYRKCIYLRKTVRKPSPKKVDRRAYKRELLLATRVSKTYPHELLSPDEDSRYSYELMSPPADGVYPVGLIQVSPSPGDGGYPLDLTSSPEDEEYIAEARRRVHDTITFPEYSSTESIVIEPVSASEDTPDDTDEPLISPVPADNSLRSSNSSPGNTPISNPTPFARIVHTPPHPMDQSESNVEIVNPQMVNALKTVEEHGHEFVQYTKPKTPIPCESSKSTEPLRTRTPELFESRNDHNKRVTGDSYKTSESTDSSRPSSVVSSPYSIVSSPYSVASSPHTFPKVIHKPFPCITPHSTVFTNPIQSINSTYNSPKINPFISPPNVTVGRLGGFTPTHGSANKTGLWPDRFGSSYPLNLSRTLNPSGGPEIPRHSAPSGMWSSGIPPYNYPPNPMSRMNFPLGTYPPPYAMGGYDFSAGYPHQHPLLTGYPFPHLPSRMEGLGHHPFPPPHNPLFPPERYPVPPPGMYPGGLYPPSVLSPFRHPQEHSIYQASQEQIPQAEDYSKSQSSKHPKTLEPSEIEKAEMEEYKKYSIFRLHSKSESNNNKELDKNQRKDAVKTNDKAPRCNNETLKKLLNSNNNNININKKEMSKSDIDDDLRNEIHKVSGYCGCNFITIDDLKMQALIRSDGVNNLEIEIPSPDSPIKDSLKMCNNNMCKQSRSKSNESEFSTNKVPKDSSNLPTKVLSKPVLVTGNVCLKQDLGDEGILMLEVQCERVKLVQCVLDDELLKQSNDPKELREYIRKSQPSEDCEETGTKQMDIDEPLDLSSAEESITLTASSRESISLGNNHGVLTTISCSRESLSSGKEHSQITSSASSRESSLFRESYNDTLRIISNNDAVNNLFTTSNQSSTNSLSQNTSIDLSNKDSSVRKFSNLDKAQIISGIPSSNTSILRNGYLVPPSKTNFSDNTRSIMHRLSTFVDTTISTYKDGINNAEPESDASLMSSDYLPSGENNTNNLAEDMICIEKSQFEPMEVENDNSLTSTSQSIESSTVKTVSAITIEPCEIESCENSINNTTESISSVSTGLTANDCVSNTCDRSFEILPSENCVTDEHLTQKPENIDTDLSKNSESVISSSRESSDNIFDLSMSSVCSVSQTVHSGHDEMDTQEMSKKTSKINSLNNTNIDSAQDHVSELQICEGENFVKDTNSMRFNELSDNHPSKHFEKSPTNENDCDFDSELPAGYFPGKYSNLKDMFHVTSHTNTIFVYDDNRATPETPASRSEADASIVR
ncbi:uncharacterized protein LOC126823780 [Patella vulgata]|uniref:uncharacterized protein LOC126823780 n=1 Tax=Patella vulgata TaxID=6465 RepID=UPI00217F6458|nr:uncharacterized protein LOC126823780 [Patella vulgata]XP_050408714.1 uncharacterized protein LOC126823780 [Patella vulgata]XP_050408715.1 uncharacterized protein LOC126823780 [Patella vulgata]